MNNAGLLHSRMGIGGSYYLAKPATEISFVQIVRNAISGILDGTTPGRCNPPCRVDPSPVG